MYDGNRIFAFIKQNGPVLPVQISKEFKVDLFIASAIISEFVAKKNWTRNWWDSKGEQYELFISESVLFELQNGDYPSKNDCLQLIENIPVLAVSEEIKDIVNTYISHKVMPSNPVGDALHLAIASYYQCDYLLTWNCSHLANANKFQHIRIVNTMMGLYIPSLITPLQLLKEM